MDFLRQFWSSIHKAWKKNILIKLSPVNWAAIVFIIAFFACSEFFFHQHAQGSFNRIVLTFPSIIYHQFLGDFRLAKAIFFSGDTTQREGSFCRLVSSPFLLRPDIVDVLKINAGQTSFMSCHQKGGLVSLSPEINQFLLTQVAHQRNSPISIFVSKLPLGKKRSHFAGYYSIHEHGHYLGSIVFLYRSFDFFSQTIPSYLVNKSCIQILDADSTVLAMNDLCSIHFDSGNRFESLYDRFITIKESDHLFHFHVWQFQSSDNLWNSYLRLCLWVLLFICVGMTICYRSRTYYVSVQRQDLLDLSSVILCVLDDAFRFKHVNEIFTNYVGSKESVINYPLIHFVLPHFHTLVSKNLERVRLGVDKCVFFEAEFSFDFIGEGNSSKNYWLIWEIRSSSFGESFYAIAQDVTEYKKVETALFKERAFRQSMGDSMTTGIQVTNLKGDVIYVNPAFCEMTGYSVSECLNSHFPFPYDLCFSEDFSDFILAWWEKSRLQNGFEVQVPRKNKSCFEAHMLLSPWVDQNQKRFGWIFSLIDVTERNRVRRILEANHQQFTTVLNSLEAAVCVFDQLQLRILFYNAYYQRNFGSTPDMHLQLCSSVPKAARAGSDQYASAEVYVESLHRWFEVRVRLIPWIDDRQNVVMSVSTDITKRKQAEQLYQQQQEKVQQTSHLITMGEMASSLAHELNQPLTAISNYSAGSISRLESGSITLDEVLVVMRKAAIQAERAGRIIRSIRDFVKKNEPRFFLCDMTELLSEAVEFSEVDAAKRNISIELAIEGELPRINVDPILVQQVLINLLKNAMDAMQGSLERVIHVRVVPHEHMLEISVADCGQGIDPEIMDKLFAPFFSTKSEGMGMGLNICRSIIEYHKGRLWAESNLDVGSTFRFTLPYVIE